MGDHHEDLVAWTRFYLEQTKLPFVIENVTRAPLAAEAVLICGSMFEPPLDVRRHRLFETNWPLRAPGKCRHNHPRLKPNRFPGGRSSEQTGHNRGLVRATIEIGAWDIPLLTQQRAMGIDWMKVKELTEAIPPIYAAHIGRELSRFLD